MFPEFDIPEGAALPSFRSEWTIAGILTVVWLAALGTYGAGYFGAADGIARQVNFLEVVVYIAALVVPLMCLWCGTLSLIHI